MKERRGRGKGWRSLGGRRRQLLKDKRKGPSKMTFATVPRGPQFSSDQKKCRTAIAAVTHTQRA